VYLYSVSFKITIGKKVGTYKTWFSLDGTSKQNSFCHQRVPTPRDSPGKQFFYYVLAIWPT